MLPPIVSAKLSMVSEVGYCPAAMRALKELTKSVRTSGVALACWTRLEKEAAEVVKLASVSTGDDVGFDAAAAVVLTGEMDGEMEKLLICISLTLPIGALPPFISGILFSGGRLMRFIGMGKIFAPLDDDLADEVRNVGNFRHENPLEILFIPIGEVGELQVRRPLR